MDDENHAGSGYLRNSSFKRTNTADYYAYNEIGYEHFTAGQTVATLNPAKYKDAVKAVISVTGVEEVRVLSDGETPAANFGMPVYPGSTAGEIVVTGPEQIKKFKAFCPAGTAEYDCAYYV